MTNIELVIKMSEQDYQLMKKGHIPFRILDVIMNGTPLSNVIDKISAEIEQAVWEDVVVSLDGTDETRIPCLDPDDVFEILDKYKESEEKNHE